MGTRENLKRLSKNPVFAIFALVNFNIYRRKILRIGLFRQSLEVSPAYPTDVLRIYRPVEMIETVNSLFIFLYFYYIDRAQPFNKYQTTNLHEWDEFY